MGKQNFRDDSNDDETNGRARRTGRRGHTGRTGRSALTHGDIASQLATAAGNNPDLTVMVERTSATSDPVKETLKNAAIRLQATEDFLLFAFGDVENLYFEDVLFECTTITNPRGNRQAAKVIGSENGKVPVGFFIFFDELRSIASHDDPAKRRYFQRASTGDREVNQQFENTKKAVMDVLLRAIEVAGGAEAINIREAMDGLREQIAAGEIGSSLLKVMDQDEVGTFGFNVGDKPLIFQTCFVPVGKGERATMIHALKLTVAPLGAPEGLVVGNYIPTYQLLKSGHSNPAASIIASILRPLWDEDEVDQVAASIANGNADVVEADEEPAPQAPVVTAAAQTAAGATVH